MAVVRNLGLVPDGGPDALSMSTPLPLRRAAARAARSLTDSWRWDVVAGAATTLSQDTLRRAGVHVADGTPVTLTLEASRFTVPGWTLEVRTSQDQ